MLASASAVYPNFTGQQPLLLWGAISGVSIGFDIPFSAISFAAYVLAFSPDGKLLASGHDYAVHLWNPYTRGLQRSLHAAEKMIISLAFSYDGRLAAGSSDKTIQIWDPETGVLQQTLDCGSYSDSWIYSMAFSPDGSLLAAGYEDKTVRLWDPATGVLQESVPMGGKPEYLEFSQDGSYLSTSLGLFVIESTPGHENDSSRARYRHSKITVEDNKWIVLNGKRAIGLPFAFRPHSWAAYGNTLALGHEAGRLSFMEFDV